MPEIFRKQREALSKLTKRINKKLDVFIEITRLRWVLGFMTIIFPVIIQVATYKIYTKHDQEIIPKTSNYLYQFNRWGNEAYQKFRSIWDENYPSKFYGENNHIDITPDLAINVTEYHSKLLEIFKILEYQHEVVIFIVRDIGILLKSGTIEKQSDLEKLKKASGEHDKVLKEFERKERAIRDYIERLNHAFNIDVEDLPTDKSSEVYINMVKLIFELIESEDLFLKRDFNHTKFFEEFHEKLKNVLTVYDDLVVLHNAQVSSDKQSLTNLYVYLASLIVITQLLQNRYRIRRKLVKRNLKKYRRNKQA